MKTSRTAHYLGKVAFALLVLFWGSHLVSAQQEAKNLYRGFLDPPRKYSPEPFWFWNGPMDRRRSPRTAHHHRPCTCSRIESS